LIILNARDASFRQHDTVVNYGAGQINIHTSVSAPLSFQFQKTYLHTTATITNQMTQKPHPPKTPHHFLLRKLRPKSHKHRISFKHFISIMSCTARYIRNGIFFTANPGVGAPGVCLPVTKCRIWVFIAKPNLCKTNNL
jgi:hypothetical protein